MNQIQTIIENELIVNKDTDINIKQPDLEKVSKLVEKQQLELNNKKRKINVIENEPNKRKRGRPKKAKQLNKSIKLITANKIKKKYLNQRSNYFLRSQIQQLNQTIENLKKNSNLIRISYENDSKEENSDMRSMLKSFLLPEDDNLPTDDLNTTKHDNQINLDSNKDDNLNKLNNSLNLSQIEVDMNSTSSKSKDTSTSSSDINLNKSGTSEF